MAKGNTRHPPFYVDSDMYYYTLMPFRLYNIVATYQRMVNKLFVGMIGVTMEAYMDDMLVKSVKGIDHTERLRKTFRRIHLHQIHLNPAKFAFGVYQEIFRGT